MPVSDCTVEAVLRAVDQNDDGIVQIAEVVEEINEFVAHSEHANDSAFVVDQEEEVVEEIEDEF